MNRKQMKWLLPLAVVLAAIAITAFIVMAGPEVETVEPERSLPVVRVVDAHSRDIRLTVTSQGTVEPSRTSEVAAQVAGRIAWVSPELVSGGSFRRGETMARLEQGDQQVAVANADAQLAQARLRLAREEAESKIAREEWKDLGTGAPPPLAIRQPQIAEAQAAVAASEAVLAQARLNLARTAITAPFDGRVSRKLAEVGQFVAPGAPIASLYAVDYAEVALPVTSEELGFIDVSSRPSVEIRGSLAGAERHWEGQIVRTSGRVDPSTRMVDLIARIDRPFEREVDGVGMQAGLFVTASIEGREATGVFVLPREALRRENRVFVVDSDGRLRFRSVGVLMTRESTVVISSGLDDGDLVVLSPMETPVEGMEVQLAREEVPAKVPDTEQAR